MRTNNPFPPLEAQDAIFREERRARVRVAVGDVLGGIGIAVFFVAGLFLAAGWGAV